MCQVCIKNELHFIQSGFFFLKCPTNKIFYKTQNAHMGFIYSVTYSAKFKEMFPGQLSASNKKKTFNLFSFLRQITDQGYTYLLKFSVVCWGLLTVTS